MLTKHQLGAYQEQGYLFPLPVLTHKETTTLRNRLEGLENQHAGRLPPLVNRKPHLLLTWLNELIRDPRILSPVADILGRVPYNSIIYGDAALDFYPRGSSLLRAY